MRTISIPIFALSMLFLSGPVHLSIAGEQAGSKPNVAKTAQAIDNEIQKQLDIEKISPSPISDDAQFLRRVTLDITGRIPTIQQATEFLNSTDPNKRRKLVDALLSEKLYGEYFAGIWADLFDATGTPPRSMATRFRSWLADELNRGRGWDKIAQSMLTEVSEPASYFAWANYKEPGELADTTARFFLGVQLQCAKCHDHPLAEWGQADYWGLAAFYTRIKRIRVKGKGNALTENPIPGKKRKAVTKGATITIPDTETRDRAGTVIRAKFLKSSEPKLPDEGALRPFLADWITSKQNPYFAKAIVNRIWAHFFGKGFVKLADGFEAGREPTHPALLQSLADEFVESGYDLKHLIRCICASQTYHRASRPLPGNRDDTTMYSHMPVRVLNADVLFDSVVTAMGNPRLRGGLAAPLPYEIYSGRKRSTNVSTRQAFIEFFGTRDENAKASAYTYGIPQVLALMNAKQFNVTPPVVEQLLSSKASDTKAVESFFLATLTRRPSEAETKLMVDYLSRRKDREIGYRGVLWILLNTNEFTLNP